MAASAWLIALAVIVPVIVLALCYYIIVYYQHPDDRNTAWVPKIVVLLGLALAMLTVLLIPFDVANQGADFGCGTLPTGIGCGGLDLFWVWQVVFLLVGVWVLLIVPWTLFYYESFDFENDTSCKACASASCSQISVTIVFLGVFVVCFVFLRFTELPVDQFTLEASNFRACPAEGCTDLRFEFPRADEIPPRVQEDVRMPVPILVFLPGFLSFLGWFLFAFYAGIGLVALPVDLIRGYLHRPVYMPNDVYAATKLSLRKRSQELLETGDKLLEEAKKAEAQRGTATGAVVSLTRRRRRREEKTIFNEFKQAVVSLEEDLADVKQCHDNWRSYNPFVPWGKLLLGILAAIVSLLWVLQIVLYNLVRDPYGPDGVPTAYFLNVMFSAASKGTDFALLGTILVGIFAAHLFFAVLKGNERFGLRFFIVEIHPVRFGGTYMNSFLVNTSLVLFCTAPLVQFVAAALAEYVVLTNLDAVFLQQVQFLTFFGIFYENNVFIIAMLAVAVLAAVWLKCFPGQRGRDARHLTKKVKQFREGMHGAAPGGAAAAPGDDGNADDDDDMQVDADNGKKKEGASAKSSTVMHHDNGDTDMQRT